MLEEAAKKIKKKKDKQDTCCDMEKFRLRLGKSRTAAAVGIGKWPAKIKKKLKMDKKSDTSYSPVEFSSLNNKRFNNRAHLKCVCMYIVYSSLY